MPTRDTTRLGAGRCHSALRRLKSSAGAMSLGTFTNCGAAGGTGYRMGRWARGMGQACSLDLWWDLGHPDPSLGLASALRRGGGWVGGPGSTARGWGALNRALRTAALGRGRVLSIQGRKREMGAQGSLPSRGARSRGCRVQGGGWGVRLTLPRFFPNPPNWISPRHRPGPHLSAAPPGLLGRAPCASCIGASLQGQRT